MSFPCGPEYPKGAISKFYENSRIRVIDLSRVFPYFVLKLLGCSYTYRIHIEPIHDLEVRGGRLAVILL
jgi:hypothetical protein